MRDVKYFMDCLQLAEKLSTKKSHTPVSPATTKKVRVEAKENKKNFVQFTCDQYVKKIPDIKFEPSMYLLIHDPNLRRYFQRYLAEKGLDCVLSFIDMAEDYKTNYPADPGKQATNHSKLMQKLGSLPGDYVQCVIPAHREMAMVTSNSFEECTRLVSEYLRSRELDEFMGTQHFIKWKLKYYNTL